MFHGPFLSLSVPVHFPTFILDKQDRIFHQIDDDHLRQQHLTTKGLDTCCHSTILA